MWNGRISQVRSQHGLVLRVGGTHFQDGYDPFEDLRRSGRDGGKEISHGVYLLLVLQGLVAAPRQVSTETSNFELTGVYVLTWVCFTNSSNDVSCTPKRGAISSIGTIDS